MIYKYYVNCFKDGEPTYAAGYVEANSEEEAINKAIESYDKNAYEFLELKEISRGQRIKAQIYEDWYNFFSGIITYDQVIAKNKETLKALKGEGEVIFDTD